MMKEERAEFEMIVNLVLGRAHTLVFLVIKAKTAFLCVFVICQVSIVVWSGAYDSLKTARFIYRQPS